MKILNRLMTIAFLGMFTASILEANCPEDTEKSFHLRSEVDEDDCDDTAEGHKPWYFHYHHHAFDEDLEDPSAELDEDAAWPGEREEFSDKLFR